MTLFQLILLISCRRNRPCLPSMLQKLPPQLPQASVGQIWCSYTDNPSPGPVHSSDGVGEVALESSAGNGDLRGPKPVVGAKRPDRVAENRRDRVRASYQLSGGGMKESEGFGEEVERGEMPDVGNKELEIEGESLRGNLLEGRQIWGGVFQDMAQVSRQKLIQWRWTLHWTPFLAVQRSVLSLRVGFPFHLQAHWFWTIIIQWRRSKHRQLLKSVNFYRMKASGVFRCTLILS